MPHGFSLLLHVGYSWGEYWDDDDVGGGALVDFMVGVGYTVGNFELALKLTGTDAAGAQKMTHRPQQQRGRVLMFTCRDHVPLGRREE